MSTELYLSYTKDELGLCRKANSDIPESDKIGHILKETANDTFNLLMCSNCATLSIP